MENNAFETLIAECNSNIELYPNLLIILKGQLEKIAEIEVLNTELKNKPTSDIYLDYLRHFNNFTGGIIISLLDLCIGMKNLLLAKSDWEKAYFIKYSFLVIFETVKKIDPSKGSSYIHQNIGKTSKSLKTEFEQSLNEVRKFSEKPVFQKVKDVRNNIAGHIDKSLINYYDSFQILNGNECAIATIEFIRLIHRISNLLVQYSKEQNDELIKINKELEEIQVKIMTNN